MKTTIPEKALESINKAIPTIKKVETPKPKNKKISRMSIPEIFAKLAEVKKKNQTGSRYYLQLKYRLQALESRNRAA